MVLRFLFSALVLCGLSPACLAAAAAPAGTAAAGPVAKAADYDPAPLVRRLWVITDAVLENHVEPPARQEMLLAGTRALLSVAGVTPPQNLGRRLSGLAGEKEFAAVLRDVWPGKIAEGRKPADLEAALLAGALTAVPGHARLLPPDFVKMTQQIGSNRYVGTGVQIRYDEKAKLAQIVVPFRRGPARRAGAKPGDLILRVDDTDVHDVGLQKVVHLLRGEAGTPVSAVVRQPGAKETRTLKMIRNEIPFDTVMGYRRISEESWKYRADCKAPIAYAWVKAINSSTAHELRVLERRLKAEGIRALVLDLRFSEGGGQMAHAAQVADALLDGGQMWRTRDAHGKVKEYRADRDCLFRGWPLAVIVDETVRDLHAQMVAAALQDNGRAVVVGAPTRGEGYGNTLVELPGGKDVLMVRGFTVERAGAKPRGWGVKPDHKVATDKKFQEAAPKWFRDKDLPELPAGTDDTPPYDPQLDKALEVLQAALGKGK
jgi:carboxyl-terminal processing protease